MSEAHKTPAEAEVTAARTMHWQHVYASKGETEVSWFEESPTVSLELMAVAGFAMGAPDAAETMEQQARIIDIGGGASRLVDELLRRGYRAITVLDISAQALDQARRRLAADPVVQADPDLRAAAGQVTWITADVTRWQPDRLYDLWHDRAALHFLTEPADQQAYRAVLTAALRKGGTAIIGTFAPDGPERCSNLPVQRHDAASLARLLGDGFELQSTRWHDHLTPWGTQQHFQFSTFTRR